MVSTDELLVHQSVLRGHCYRMLGHPHDADDAVQDTFERAIGAVDRFEGRAAPKTWLLRIATNVCLDRLKQRKRRWMPTERPPGTPDGPFAPTDTAEWMAPVPTAWLGPDVQHERAQDLRFAVLTVLQRLPPRQRAAWILMQTWGWRASEVAEALDWTVAGVNSAVQRARVGLDAVPPPVEADPTVVERYAAAFEAFDLQAMLGLLADDIRFDMPPFPLWLRGRTDVERFLQGPGAECRGSVLVPTSANGQLAFGQYRDGGRTPWALLLLESAGPEIVGVHNFLDVGELFPLFGLPAQAEDRR